MGVIIGRLLFEPSRRQNNKDIGAPHRGTKYSYYAGTLALLLRCLDSDLDIFIPPEINSPLLAELYGSFIVSFEEYKWSAFMRLISSRLTVLPYLI
jgi:hypothetical protein